jgi:hypothetical protein
MGHARPAPSGRMNLEETLNDSCAEWLNSLLRAPTVREGSSTFSLSHFKSLPRALTVREDFSTRQHTLPLASNVCRDGDPLCRAATRCTDGGEMQERERPSLTVGALSGSPDAAPPASLPILPSTAGFLSHAPSGRMSLERVRTRTTRPIGADEFRGDPERLLRRMAQLPAQSPDRKGGFFDFLTFSLQKPAQSPDCTGGFFDTPAHTSSGIQRMQRRRSALSCSNKVHRWRGNARKRKTLPYGRGSERFT